MRSGQPLWLVNPDLIRARYPQFEAGRAARDATAVSLSVHNESPPIPDHVLPTLFDPFRRGESGAARGNGLGLGLLIVREIARAHGGGVEVRSAEGEGTTFTLRVPCSGSTRSSPT